MVNICLCMWYMCMQDFKSHGIGVSLFLQRMRCPTVLPLPSSSPSPIPIRMNGNASPSHWALKPCMHACINFLSILCLKFHYISYLVYLKIYCIFCIISHMFKAKTPSSQMHTLVKCSSISHSKLLFSKLCCIYLFTLIFDIYKAP